MSLHSVEFSLRLSNVSVAQLTQSLRCCHSPSKNEIKIPEAPTNCCMSGCPNCVWVEYAEELSKIFKDGGEKSRAIILEKVTDPNMRAFLMMELKNIPKKSDDHD